MKIFLLTAVFIAGSVYLQWQGARLNDKEEQLSRAITVLQRETGQQRIKNAGLKDDIDALRQHPDELFEELAREKLFMIMPDEIYVLPDSEAS